MLRLTLTALLLLAPTALAQGRAWRDLTFGITNTEYRALLDSYDDVTRSIAGTRATLGSVDVTLFAQFADGQLARLMFHTGDLTASSFDGLLQQRLNSLAEIITTATGTPPRRHHPDFFSVRPGVTWTHTWPVGEDGVLRRVGISMVGFEYRAVLWIEDQVRMAAWEAQRRAEEAEARRDAADDF